MSGPRGGGGGALRGSAGGWVGNKGVPLRFGGGLGLYLRFGLVVCGGFQGKAYKWVYFAKQRGFFFAVQPPARHPAAGAQDPVPAGMGSHPGPHGKGCRGCGVPPAGLGEPKGELWVSGKLCAGSPAASTGWEAG